MSTRNFRPETGKVEVSELENTLELPDFEELEGGEEKEVEKSVMKKIGLKEKLSPSASAARRDGQISFFDYFRWMME